MALMPQLEDFRIVDFKVAGHWMVKFDDLYGVPTPFDTFLPVESVKEPLFSLEAKPIDVGFFNSSIPYTSKNQDITIRFFDRSDNVLLQWFIDWGQQLVTDKHVAYVKDVVRRLSIYKYTSNRTSYLRSSYYVFPTGDLDEDLTHGGEAVGYTLNLNVTGVIERNVSGG